jgi:ketosteroid isomerase-like protein
MIAAAEDIESNNKKAIQAGFDAWRNGTGGVFNLLASDAKWTIVGNSPVSRTFMSRQELVPRRRYNSLQRAALEPAGADGSRRLRRWRHGDRVVGWRVTVSPARTRTPGI